MGPWQTGNAKARKRLYFFRLFLNALFLKGENNMAKVNVKKESVRTHEGAKAYTINAEAQLRRSVMSCMLWEREFYEEGESIADRIKKTIPSVKPEKVAQIAIEAREKMKLRHVPLLIVREMARYESHRPFVATTLERVIQRADELTEFLAIYWKDKKEKLASSVKRGLAKAFPKFNEYQLAKYNRDGAIKLRDVLFLCHAKPIDKKQGKVWKRLVDKELKTPDTWEVMLSAGKDKKKTFEKLIKEENLGALALLRNLRNMQEAGVSNKIIEGALESMKVERVLPFRFMTAAVHAPKLEHQLESAMFRCVESQKKLKGKTIVVVDVSGSMYGANISQKSEVTRAKAACSLAVLIRELSDNTVIYATAGNDSTRVHKTQEVPVRRGFALSDAIHQLCTPLGGGGIFLTQTMAYIKNIEKEATRIIVITDEQDCAGDADAPTKADAFAKHNYLINVASARNGIGYGKWTHIDGFSEAVINFIQEYEN